MNSNGDDIIAEDELEDLELSSFSFYGNDLKMIADRMTKLEDALLGQKNEANPTGPSSSGFSKKQEKSAGKVNSEAGKAEKNKKKKMDAENGQTPKAEGENAQMEEGNDTFKNGQTAADDEEAKPKLNRRYLFFGTFAFIVVLFGFAIAIILGSDSELVGMKNKVASMDEDLLDKAKLLSEKIIDLEDARKHNEALAKDLEEKMKQNAALEEYKSKELASIVEMEILQQKIRNDLQIKELSGSLDLILSVHTLAASKFSIASLKTVVANFEWWVTVSDREDPNHLGIWLHMRPPKTYGGDFNVQGEIIYSLKHVLPSSSCGFFVCNEDFVVKKLFNYNKKVEKGLLYRKFAEIKQVIDPGNGFVTLENNLHLKVNFHLTEATLDHYLKSIGHQKASDELIV